jgi:hypothetical protein
MFWKSEAGKPEDEFADGFGEPTPSEEQMTTVANASQLGGSASDATLTLSQHQREVLQTPINQLRPYEVHVVLGGVIGKLRGALQDGGDKQVAKAPDDLRDARVSLTKSEDLADREAIFKAEVELQKAYLSGFGSAYSALPAHKR